MLVLAKHISKSECTKGFRSEALLEAEMLIKCTELWHEAHFEVQMHNTLQVRSTFGSWDVEKMQAAVVRSKFQVKM